MNTRRFLTLLAVMALAVAGCRGGTTHGTGGDAVTVGPYTMSLENRPAPPRTGENTIVVRIADAAGKPVDRAEVSLVASMPAMGAMPYMESRARVRESKPGEYLAAYGLSMAGDWDVHVRVVRGEAPAVESAWRISTHLEKVAYAGPSAESDSSAAALVTLDAARRQAIGVKLARVERRTVAVPLRLRGTVAWDETQRADVSLRVSGWAREVRVASVGQAVGRGQTLFTAYSPEVYAAEREFVSALGFARADSSAHAVAFGSGTAGGGPVVSLDDAARQRLRLMDVPADEIDAVEKDGAPRETFSVRAPSAGVVVEKSIVRGSPFAVGEVLYRIASLDPVWIEADVYEADLPYVKPGVAARVEGVGAERTGRVTFVAPTLQGDARTARARVSLANPSGTLKPGMFVDVTIEGAPASRIVVPRDAVVPTGEKNFVFVDRGEGRLEPRPVTVGVRGTDWVEIVAGLAEGETVVASGNFLVAADARLRTAMERP